MNEFYVWLNYVFVNLQRVADFISSNWLLSTMLIINIIYLVIIAVKLKKNTD